MITPKNIYQEIQNITSKLIKFSLCNEQNFPSQQNSSGNKVLISYSNMQDFSIALRNIPYKDIYSELDQGKNYNFKMLDGALIQLLYTYQKNKLISHRLAFFPSPDLESFHNEPEIYEEDKIYADIIAKDILPTPIRFDYDPKSFKNIDHPESHLTLGQFKNCRIPVSSPITPNVFMKFILQNFYHTAFKRDETKLSFPKTLFDNTITAQEKEILHIAIE